MPRVVVPATAADLYAALHAVLGARPGPAGSPPVALQPLAHDDATLPPDAALVVRTSGSTGTPREVVLTRSALRASIGATAARLGGHGRWLLALPWHHVAGAQVVARSALAGTAPEHLPDEPFTPARFAEHAAAFLRSREPSGPGARAYVSIVPTQLHRVVEAARAGEPAAVRVLAGFDAVLVGGAATAPDLLAEARARGVRVVTTYGMSETCGGCVYDGVPLDGVRVRLGEQGRVELGGPVVAAGYLGDDATARDANDAAFTEDDGTRWFRTSDLGAVEDGRLRVLGRADDVVVTGGEKVAPVAVEHALAPLGEVCVVGVPDREWGQAVVAVVVRAGTPGLVPAPDAVAGRARSLVRDALGPHAAPRRVLLADHLPLRGPGKTDRRGLATQVTAAIADLADV